MTEENTISKLGNAYENNPYVRALITAATNIPGAGLILGPLDEAVLAQRAQMQENRARTFFDELVKGEHQLSEELIQDHDFLHAYFSTLNAAIRTRREEKNRLFVRLLQNSLNEGFYKTDDFEEFVAILDDLSMREFEILMQLKPFQDDSKDHPQNKEANELTIIDAYWEQFEEEITLLLGISKGELSALLSRLNRTGLYKNNPPGFLNSPGVRGTLTPLFYKFIEKLMDNYKSE